MADISDLDHVMALLDERDRRYGERFAAQEKANEINANTAKEYREIANEWRGALSDMRAEFPLRAELQAALDRIDKLEGASQMALGGERRAQADYKTRSMTTSQVVATAAVLVAIATVLVSAFT